MTFDAIPRGIEVLLLILVLTAAIYDVRYRRIPNWLTSAGVLLGIATNTFLAFDGVERWSGLILSVEGLLAGFFAYLLLYLIRAMGAGDVKLMAAVGAMVGPRDWFGIFLITAILGGIMALILVLARKRLKKTFFNLSFIVDEMRHGRPAYMRNEELDVKSGKSLGLPHGAVIAVGTLFFLALTSPFAR
jgi:prepilin peptidase CpaA